jgi:predicted porin
MKKVGSSLVLVGALGAISSAVYAADLPLPTKDAPLILPTSAACASLYDFAVTACPLAWGPFQLYGTVDVGGSYMTHGTPFDPNYQTSAGYLIGNGGTNATGRLNGFFLAPNAMSPSNIGLKVNQPLGSGVSFVAQYELAFDPYSLLLSNAPQALQNGIGVAENQQALPLDGSRWGWLNTNQYVGFSSLVGGTLTFGRQNALVTDGVIAYDPMGGAYGFSLGAGSGKTAGAGDTEDSRWTTAIKYRENVGDLRLSAMLQPIGLWSNNGGYGTYNPNNGAVAVGIGGDARHLGPGTLSLDVIATFEKDATNITTTFPGQTTVNGWPTSFPSGPAGSGLKATVSDQTAVTVLAKYSFGSWGNTLPPLVGKAAVAPSGPTGIPLTLYAGYEWIQYANPSDPQSVYHDDGFLFTATNSGASVLNPFTSTTIANNAYNASCAVTGSAGCEKEIFQVVWTGAKYGITKDLDITGAYYHYIQSAFVIAPAAFCATASAHSQCAGWFDAYSAVLDWRFLPKWDTYLGVMYSAAFGGLANGDISRNNLAATGGVRFRF